MQRRHPLKPFTSPVIHQFTQRRGRSVPAALLSHTSQCVLSVCVLCCVLCFDVFWCCLVCLDVLCCVVLCWVVSCRVVSCRGVAYVCVCVCACVNVSKSVWCVVSCHVVINGPREQQSANSAIRCNSYDLTRPNTASLASVKVHA